MIKKNGKDVVEIFHELKKVLAAKPSTKVMFEEIRMMKFKIRPISGDVSLLQFDNSRLIETLWSLGKLDETFQKEFQRLSKDQKEVFFRMFDELYLQFQSQLNKISVRPEAKSSIPQMLEMEIFKDLTAKKRVN